MGGTYINSILQIVHLVYFKIALNFVFSAQIYQDVFSSTALVKVVANQVCSHLKYY